MTAPFLELHPDRLLPAEPGTRAIARELYAAVRQLPIISPHGHTDPEWFASDANFGNAAQLLLHPDHYVFRMLYSQGVALADLGIGNLVHGSAGLQTLPYRQDHLVLIVPESHPLAQHDEIDFAQSLGQSDAAFGFVDENLTVQQQCVDAVLLIF